MDKPIEFRLAMVARARVHKPPVSIIEMPIEELLDKRVFCTIFSFYGYADQVVDLFQRLDKKTRKHFKSQYFKMTVKHLVRHRFHPYSWIPVNIKPEDIWISEVQKVRKRDVWRLPEPEQLILDVWSDAKIKTLDQLLQSLANSLRTKIKSDDNSRFTAWALVIEKRFYDYSMQVQNNVDLYLERSLPKNYIIVLAAKYQNSSEFSNIVTDEIRKNLSNQFYGLYKEQNIDSSF